MTKLLGALLGVVLLAAVILLGLWLRKSRGGEKRYDERQLTLRAEGYKRGFFVTLLAEALGILLLEVEVIPPACASLAVFVALMAGVVTFAVFCIVKDVFLSMGDRSRNYLLLWGLIVVLDGALAVSRIADGTILENGLPTFGSCNQLVMALSFLVVFAAQLVRRAGGERDE